MIVRPKETLLLSSSRYFIIVAESLLRQKHYLGGDFFSSFGCGVGQYVCFQSELESEAPVVNAPKF